MRIARIWGLLLLTAISQNLHAQKNEWLFETGVGMMGGTVDYNHKLEPVNLVKTNFGFARLNKDEIFRYVATLGYQTYRNIDYSNNSKFTYGDLQLALGMDVQFGNPRFMWLPGFRVVGEKSTKAPKLTPYYITPQRLSVELRCQFQYAFSQKLKVYGGLCQLWDIKPWKESYLASYMTTFLSATYFNLGVAYRPAKKS